MNKTDDKVIAVSELTKVFRDFWGRPKVVAVNKLSFDVNYGEVFGLLGPNGSGKSTTIKILLGLLFATSGKISVFGRSPRNVANKHRIGFLPEESYLYPYQNAEEALTFYGQLFRLPRKICQQRVDNLLDMVGLKQASKRPLKEYSKGMARRIGIAQALINDPDLVIFDEPTSGLDPIGTREIKDIIIDLKKHGKSIILCSHLLADLEDLCDRVIILYGGKQSSEGKISDLLSKEDATQIVSSKLSPEALERLKEWFKNEQAEIQSVGAPLERLETFFLRVIEEARKDDTTTSGAQVGKKIENFFTDTVPEKTGESLLQNLVAKKEEPSEDIPQDKVEDKASSEVLSGLVKTEKEKKAEKVILQPASEPKKEKLEVLDQLVKPTQKEPQDD